MTVWCSQAAIAAAEKQKVLHMCVCWHSCVNYPACKLLLFIVIVIICSLLALPYFYTLSRKQYDGQKKMSLT